MTPPEREAAQRRLVRAAAELGVALTPQQVEQLVAFQDLLVKWNAVYNLSALRDPAAIVNRHLVDCLAIIGPLARVAAARGLGRDAPLRILDVGSGGGLPGVVVAVSRPDWTVDCIDAVGKKAAFVRQVAAELALPSLQGWHARVEDWHRSAQAADGYDIVTSRAFASLGDFVRKSAQLLRPRGVWVAMKGAPSADEIGAMPPSYSVFHVEQLHLPGIDLKRSLVWIERQPH